MPFLRGPPGLKGEKGEKGEKGDPSDRVSTTFIRWGKTTCSKTNGTTEIYSGRIAGQYYTDMGGTSSNLCLHMNTRFTSNAGDTGQYIHGTAYENNRPFTKNLVNHEAVRVVCMVNSHGSKVIVISHSIPTGYSPGQPPGNFF